MADPHRDRPEDHASGGSAGPPPWERRPGESAAAWEAFRCYRDLGLRRSLDEVDRRLFGGPPPAERPGSAGPAPPERPRRRRGHLGVWSRQHDWVARAAAWDAELDRQARLAQVEAVREMNKRHAQEGRLLQAKAVEALRALAAGGMGPADIARWLGEGAKLERLALGQVTEAVRQEQSGESRLVLEVVERIVPVRGDDAVTGSAGLPPATGGAGAGPAGQADPDEVVDDGTGEPPELSLPDEPPGFGPAARR